MTGLHSLPGDRYLQRQRPVSNRPGTLALQVTTLLAAAFVSARADTISGTGWKGTAGNNKWSSPGNWDSTAPNTSGTGDRNLFFGQAYKAAGGTVSSPNNDLTSWSGYRITFQDSNAAGNGTDGTSANDTSFTIIGNGFGIFDFGGNFPRIENDSFVVQTFTLTSGQTLTLNGQTGGQKAEINPVNANITFSAGTKIDLAGTTQLQIYGDNKKSLAFNDVISSSGNSGANSIAINQNSTVTFAAANTYAGDTFINAGTLQISSGGSCNSSIIRIGDTSGIAAATLSAGSGASFASTIVARAGTSGQRTLSMNSTTGTATASGNLFLDADLAVSSTSSGTLVLSGGTLDLKNQTMTVSGSGNTTLSGVLQQSTGSGKLTKSGTGTLTLSGNNTYSGGTTLSAGTIGIGDNNALGSGTLQIGISGSSAMGIQSVDATAHTIANALGTLTGSGVNVTIGATSGGTGDLIFTSGLNLAASSATRTFTVNNTTTFQGILAATAGTTLVKAGGGTLVLSGANTYDGTTTINAGTVSINSIANVGGGASALGAPTTGTRGTIAIGTTTTGGTLAYTGSGHNTDRVIDLAGTTGGAVLDASGSGALPFASALPASGAGSKTLTLQGSSAAANTLSAVVDNSGLSQTSLTKTGTGKWALSGTSTYTGATTVSQGTLLVNGSIASGSAVTVQSGATLGGTGSINGSVNVQAGATLSPGASIGTLTVAGAVTLAGTASMELNKSGATTTSDKLVRSGGALAYGGTLNVSLLASSDALAGGETFDLFDATSFSGAFSSTSLPALSAGLNWWLGQLSVDGTINVNRAPVAFDKTYTRAKGTSLKIRKADLLADASDPDAGDSVSYDAFIYSGSATMTENATTIFYQPASDANDSLQYRVRDTRGGTRTKTISINVVNATGLAQTLTVSGGTVTVSFAGIPDYSYQVQRSTNLVDWVTRLTTNAPSTGVFQFTDDFNDLGAPPSQAYYRLRQP